VGKISSGAEKLWLGVAREYHQLDAVTLAESAAKKAGNSPEADDCIMDALPTFARGQAPGYARSRRLSRSL
jgi:hypothetical protein